MRKEHLFISTEKVRVEYEFANESDRDIVTEVAFPIPPFQFEFDDPGGSRSLDDFRLWVEGKALKYNTEVKAFVKQKDVTPLLRKFGVDANSFGNFDWNGSEPASSDFNKLPASARNELVRAGAFAAGEGPSPMWTVHKKYHWTQRFPARGLIYVVHEYKPVLGFQPIETSDLDPARRKSEIAEKKAQLRNGNTHVDQWGVDNAVALDQTLSNACIDAKLREGIDTAVAARRNKPRSKNAEMLADYVGLSWVDYILTTAKSWKMPIGEFELDIEKPEPSDSYELRKSFMSLCWDGSATKLDDFHYRIRAKDFIPKRELHIAFFN